VTLTFDLDIQTRPSDGPNTSTQWILCKSVQRFQRYLRHKQKNDKKSQTVLKTEPYLRVVIIQSFIASRPILV